MDILDNWVQISILSLWLKCLLLFYDEIMMMLLYENVYINCCSVISEKEHRLHFRVKFYAIDPSVLQDNTRYQFFLQLKNDIASDRCVCVCVSLMCVCVCVCVCVCMRACECMYSCSIS